MFHNTIAGATRISHTALILAYGWCHCSNNTSLSLCCKREYKKNIYYINSLQLIRTHKDNSVCVWFLVARICNLARTCNMSPSAPN